jgi:hypothetical protein
MQIAKIFKKAKCARIKVTGSKEIGTGLLTVSKRCRMFKDVKHETSQN